MISVGLTGNIGSGKSTVCSIFSALGIQVYHADEESKKFLSHPDVIADLASLFGQKILTESGMISRKALAAIVFADDSALASLNELLHPLVREDARKWSAMRAAEPYVIHEAAIIFESGFREEYGGVIYVTCPQETAIARVMKRDGAPREEVMRRLRHQWDDEKKLKLSDHVIVNDGMQLVVPQVVKIHQELIRTSPSPTQ